MFKYEEITLDNAFPELSVNVAQLLKEATGATRKIELSSLSDLPCEDLRGQLKLTRTGRGVLLNGRVSLRFEATCSRCLENTVQEVSSEVDEEFLPLTDINTGLPLPVETELGSVHIDEKHILNVGEIIRQYLVSSLPINPICGPTCAGLCGNCGQNLNLRKCSCSVRESKSSLSGLVKLKLKGS